jgi:dimethylhistidine N-methyltransferase
MKETAVSLTTAGKGEANLSDIKNIIKGLEMPLAEISPKYFYNDLGSQLFEIITKLEAYYPTRTERAVMLKHKKNLSELLQSYAMLVDLGAGNCQKAKELFEAQIFDSYVAIDISQEFLIRHVANFQKEFPFTQMKALSLDFMLPFQLPKEIKNNDKVFFYPGSSIGNFTPLQAEGFLRNLAEQKYEEKLNAILIGVDLVKDVEVLNEAYDDPLGVTASFNLNVLDHLNQLINTDFVLKEWAHVAFFNQEQSRIEMYLESKSDQVVTMNAFKDNKSTIANRELKWSRRFNKNERILTEYSYKYTLEGFKELLSRAGFKSVTSWTDEREWFGIFFAEL